MEENKKTNLGQQGTNERQSDKETRHETVKGTAGRQDGAANVAGSGMDEKSSGLGRRDKGTGLSTKDGLTGSDYDGQVTE